ncbi:MAG TPA: ATP-grasp domain-containing protein [Streptosporangiaceae bacterium]|nr:ATP-grasp domain-containing protein [Streptosporangiaceae bacterium]
MTPRRLALGPLVLVGVGRRSPFREYAVAAMAERAGLVLMDIHEPAWPKPFIRSFHLITEPGPEPMLATGRAAISAERAAGIATYDDRYTVPVARLAAEAGLPGSGLAAAIACKDKWETRQRLASRALGAVRASLVTSAAEAVAAARDIGLPVVLKPRALAASKGVVRVDDSDDVARGFAIAAAASVPDPVFSAPGVLVEECVDGAEFSVDSVICQGQVTPVFVARKLLGPRPFFEEVGHCVTASGLHLLPAIGPFLQAVHEALGFADGVSHAELRVTPDGYKIMEVNSRLGGGMIPYLGFLATGIDLAGAVADVALGAEPDLRPRRDPGAEPVRAAAIRFICPERDLTVASIDVPDAVRADPRVERVVPLVEPGAVLRLPPAGYLGRIAMVITTGDSEQACQEAMDDALAKITVTAAA